MENEVIEPKQNRLVCIRGTLRNTTLIWAKLESMRKIRFLVLLAFFEGWHLKSVMLFFLASCLFLPRPKLSLNWPFVILLQHGLLERDC